MVDETILNSREGGDPKTMKALNEMVEMWVDKTLGPSYL